MDWLIWILVLNVLLFCCVFFWVLSWWTSLFRLFFRVRRDKYRGSAWIWNIVLFIFWVSFCWWMFYLCVNLLIEMCFLCLFYCWWCWFGIRCFAFLSRGFCWCVVVFCGCKSINMLCLWVILMLEMFILLVFCLCLCVCVVMMKWSVVDGWGCDGEDDLWVWCCVWMVLMLMVLVWVMIVWCVWWLIVWCVWLLMILCVLLSGGVGCCWGWCYDVILWCVCGWCLWFIVVWCCVREWLIFSVLCCWYGVGVVRVDECGVFFCYGECFVVFVVCWMN